MAASEPSCAPSGEAPAPAAMLAGTGLAAGAVKSSPSAGVLIAGASIEASVIAPGDPVSPLLPDTSPLRAELRVEPICAIALGGSAGAVGLAPGALEPPLAPPVTSIPVPVEGLPSAPSLLG